MHDGGGPLFRNLARQCIVHLVDKRQVTSFLGIELPVPTLQLSRDVSLVARQINKAHLL